MTDEVTRSIVKGQHASMSVKQNVKGITYRICLCYDLAAQDALGVSGRGTDMIIPGILKLGWAALSHSRLLAFAHRAVIQ